MRKRRWFLEGALCALIIGAAGSQSAWAEQPIAAVRTKLYAAYETKLAELATWCDDKNLTDCAREVRTWLPRREGHKSHFFDLDDLRRHTANTADPKSENEHEFRERFSKLRRQQADLLYELAQQAARDGQPSLAYQLITETARENPDHKAAWRILGYMKYRDAWHTPFEVKQLSAGKVWHDKFGWLPKSHVARYENGQRFFRSRWMSADEEAKLRSDIQDGWQVESGHYLVTTNHSLEEGVSLAERLERLRAIWQQVFAGYLIDGPELAKRLAKGEPARNQNSNKHKVVCYRTRQEYNAALRSDYPEIDIETLGIYFDNVETAFFFAGAEQDPGTIYHEATHQLFKECRKSAANVGRKDNFWIIEGVACYMESLTPEEGYSTLGGADAGRMPAARQRLLRDNFYMPLAQLVKLGLLDLQKHSDVAKLYSQSAGLATFLVSVYPEATAKYLQAIYTGRADQATLSKITNQKYDQLDRQYRAFLESLTP